MMMISNCWTGLFLVDYCLGIKRISHMTSKHYQLMNIIIKIETVSDQFRVSSLDELKPQANRLQFTIISEVTVS